MNETEQLEEYLYNRLNPQDRLLIDARCLIDSEFRDKLHWQQKTYEVINHFGRKKLKAEIKAVEHSMFSENAFANFRNKIKNIFK